MYSCFLCSLLLLLTSLSSLSRTNRLILWLLVVSIRRLRGSLVQLRLVRAFAALLSTIVLHLAIVRLILAHRLRLPRPLKTCPGVGGLSLS